MSDIVLHWYTNTNIRVSLNFSPVNLDKNVLDYFNIYKFVLFGS